MLGCSNDSTPINVDQKFRPLALMLMCCFGLSCGIHLSPSRVAPANEAVISFLLKYCRDQEKAHAASGSYEERLVPSERFRVSMNLVNSYDKVSAYGYACRFTVSEIRFAAICDPLPTSGLLISFYADQSRAIRISTSGSAGMNSRLLDLDPMDQQRLLEEP